MVTPAFAAVVRKGKLQYIQEGNYNAFLHNMLDGEQVNVSIKKRRRDRSSNQNRWYWGVILPLISAETGHTENELHEILKRMFLPPRIIEFRGKTFKVPGSTQSLSVQEFTEYVERVRAYAATELNLNIPDPE